MGCVMIFACQTCQTVTCLGEGSYSTWLTTARSVEAFDRQPLVLQALPKNQRYRACLVAHATHTWRVYDPDNEESS
jgi:hypothetical protein